MDVGQWTVPGNEVYAVAGAGREIKLENMGSKIYSCHKCLIYIYTQSYWFVDSDIGKW